MKRRCFLLVLLTSFFVFIHCIFFTDILVSGWWPTLCLSEGWLHPCLALSGSKAIVNHTNLIICS